ncbi:MAG TPA: curli-like amyloid fiber formation chaperone CsgH [Devosia sp.]|nr:curli-like amyloid fiber formation chaperone CsgH [Devosia sp.]
MSLNRRLTSIAALGLGLAALAVTGGMANALNHPAASGECGIVTSQHNGMLVIEGQVLSPVALRGSYEFAVQSRSKGGNSNIRQGGEFSAPADQPTTIGQVMLNADAQYQIDFSISHGGKTIDCSGKHITQL